MLLDSTIVNPTKVALFYDCYSLDRPIVHILAFALLYNPVALSDTMQQLHKDLQHVSCTKSSLGFAQTQQTHKKPHQKVNIGVGLSGLVTISNLRFHTRRHRLHIYQIHEIQIDVF